MTVFRWITIIIAFVLAAAEVGRWWGKAEFFPLAFDELAVACALFAAALTAGRFGTGVLVAGWGLLSGLVLGLLVPTVNHLINGPDKESAVFYSVGLGVLMIISLAGLAWTLICFRREPSRSV
jgi:hypothetical protein